MVYARRALILVMAFVPNVKVVVRVYPRIHHHHVGSWDILEQEAFQLRIDPVGRNLVIGKL